jgi:hypothetical protein
MGEQHAGRIEFATIQPVESAVACEPRGVILGSLGAGLGERVAKPLAGQHAAVEETLLLLAPLQTQGLEHEEVVLRDRAARAVGAR